MLPCVSHVTQVTHINEMSATHRTTHCNTLQHIAQHIASLLFCVLSCVAICCSVLQWVVRCVADISFMCVDLCDMTHIYEWLYAWHDSYICVTLHRYLCDMTHAYVWFVWHDSFVWVNLCVTWLICMCDLCDRSGKSVQHLGYSVCCRVWVMSHKSHI